ncbi:unnamed protein product [marine sediment metagenome]|uniref:Uncharacterized protein n=1 Tax=marine sediment metagenome TaxID=412755 RepID=X1C890_9ZZZZ
MVMEEIYLLTHHAGYSAEYIENIPVFKRRFYLNLLKQELMGIKEEQDRIASKTKHTVSSRRR